MHFFSRLALSAVDACRADDRLGDRIFQQAPEGAKAVFPADFLAFFVGAAPVADADLINSQAALGHFDGDLWLKAKAVLLDRNRLDNFATEDFVTGFHVAQVDVGEAVRKQGQQAVADRMPEVENAMRAAAQKT